MPKIAVYAICKNESKFIDRFYNSVKDADYIIFFDTGSTDDTYEKLQKLASSDDKIIVSQKRYDDWRFDVARNDAMDLCPTDTDIFVSVDLDEIFDDGWTGILKNNWICGKHTRAEYWYVWSHNDDGSDGRKFRYNKIHDRSWQWKYHVHELLADRKTDSEMYNIGDTLELPDAVVLHHFPDADKPRTSYLPLLEKRYKAYGDRYGMFYLGHEYFYRSKYGDCIEMLNKVKSMCDSTDTERAACELFIGDSYWAMGECGNAEKAYLRGIAEDRTYFEPYYYLGKMYYSLERYEECAEILKRGLRERIRHYSWIEREEPWYYGPWDFLSIASYKTARLRESLIFAVKAAAICQTEQRLSANVQAILKNDRDGKLLICDV